MRLAVLSDVHANREALAACLDHARLLSVDRFVFLGDIVGYNADPAWTVDTVMAFAADDAIVVLGNHDDAVVRGAREGMRTDAQRVVEWTNQKLDEGQRHFLAQLPLSAESGDTLFVHANAWAPESWEYVTAVFEARRCFTAARRRVTFFGHIHLPVLYHQDARGMVNSFTPVPGVAIPLGGRRWLANPGSVGQPRDGVAAASYLVFDEMKGTFTYYRVPYDYAAAARKILDAGLPEWFGRRLAGGN